MSEFYINQDFKIKRVKLEISVITFIQFKRFFKQVCMNLNCKIAKKTW